MNEKKRKIIESAIKLFASKGFYATTIQEIANQSGVSKGAFYLHFKSKEELIMAVFHYYYDVIRLKIDGVDQALTPKGKFENQLYVWFNEVIDHQEFIIMQLRESSMSLNEQADELIYQIRLKTMSWYEDSLIAIYGDKVYRYRRDLAILLDGIVRSYFKILILDEVRLDLHQLVIYICQRMDDLVTGLLEKKEEPLVTDLIIQTVFNKHFINGSTYEKVKKELDTMEHTVNKLELDDDKIEELKSTVDILLNELKMENPRKFLFKGMLSNVIGIKELENSTQKIINWLGLSIHS